MGITLMPFSRGESEPLDRIVEIARSPVKDEGYRRVILSLRNTGPFQLQERCRKTLDLFIPLDRSGALMPIIYKELKHGYKSAREIARLDLASVW
jgi:hypothetical protein